MSQPPRVLFVSKPISPPFKDGSKCLVRDLCLHLQDIDAHLMSTKRGAPELSTRAVLHDVYRDEGSFAPGLSQNLQAFAWLGLSPSMDIWHSIFAPNPKSSLALGALARLRRVRTCQTIASPPRSFEHPERLLFGDVVVAQSDWTRRQFLNAYESDRARAPKIIEIPPPCPNVALPNQERLSQVRQHLGLGPEEIVFLYPGDLEVSSASAKLCEWAGELRHRIPGARLVMAYREKTAKSTEAAARLATRCDPAVVLFEKNVPDILALVATSRALVFPVDDLFGKVDLPIVLLEAMRLKTPVLALGEGPLKSMHGAQLLGSDPVQWLSLLEELDRNESLRAEIVETGSRAVEEHYAPARIAREYRAIYRELMSPHTRSQMPLVMQ